MSITLYCINRLHSNDNVLCLNTIYIVCAAYKTVNQTQIKEQQIMLKWIVWVPTNKVSDKLYIKMKENMHK